jgi:hypothetical protein
VALTRRELIKTGAAGVALLALANCARSSNAARPFADSAYDYRMLSENDRVTIAAIANAMLAGALPPAQPAHDAAMLQVVRGVDIAINGLPPNVRDEVHQLFGLLEFAPSRALAAGIWSDWQDADAKDVAKFLTRWRFSNITLFQTGYQALHQLVMASWYGNGASWQRIGYPGPPAIAS